MVTLARIILLSSVKLDDSADRSDSNRTAWAALAVTAGKDRQTLGGLVRRLEKSRINPVAITSRCPQGCEFIRFSGLQFLQPAFKPGPSPATECSPPADKVILAGVYYLAL